MSDVGYRTVSPRSQLRSRSDTCHLTSNIKSPNTHHPRYAARDCTPLKRGRISRSAKRMKPAWSGPIWWMQTWS